MDVELVVLECGHQVLLAKDGEVLLVKAVCALGVWSVGASPHKLRLVQQGMEEQVCLLNSTYLIDLYYPV